MDEPVKFAILDMESGNAVSYFTSADEAERALILTVQEMPEEKEHLALVGYNKLGEAVGAIMASRLPEFA